MAINREQLVSRHNPKLINMDIASPLTVGNGEFAFTADITGLQTLYKEYQKTLPLCTMSQWGWHTKPVNNERYSYTLDDLVMTTYDYAGRTVRYPKQRFEGNEEIYDWLRTNPHRLNLGRIGFLYQGKEIKQEDITQINQELKLYKGKLLSKFYLHGIPCEVETCCDSKKDKIAVKVDSDLLVKGDLSVCIHFPYGSSEITGADWNQKELHQTTVKLLSDHHIVLERKLDKDQYAVSIITEQKSKITTKQHIVDLKPMSNQFSFSVEFYPNGAKVNESFDTRIDEIFENTKNYWKNFWEEGGAVQLNRSKDPRALELERRIVLSQYLLAINSCGSTPPQETGLTCNSWYGKMHLEMYFWHCAWAPLWNHSELLERSLPWFVEHIKEARENAARNGYKGSRWPKMIANEGIDCPSPVAPLLIWQQPHIIFMLELIRRQNNDIKFMEKYWVLIEETAEFMVDYVVYNEETKRYDIVAPVIPVQECHRPEDTKNPAFELEYFSYTLKIASEWAKTLGKSYDKKWDEVASHMAELPVGDGLYLAHELCPNTFTAFNKDHPSMLGAFGVLPNEKISKEMMKATLDKVLECWRYEYLWGWDFAVMAMTATRLGDPDTAVDILLLDSPKNNYVASGNNRQILRNDLPLYLPGNGALLLAIPLMVAGFEGEDSECPGFPKDGNWVVEHENINKYV